MKDLVLLIYLFGGHVTSVHAVHPELIYDAMTVCKVRGEQTITGINTDLHLTTRHGATYQCIVPVGPIEEAAETAGEPQE